MRAISSATRPTARTRTTARRIQPQAVELDDAFAAVVVDVVVGCEVVVLAWARVVVVAGTVVVVAGTVDVVAGTVVVVVGAVVVVVTGAVVVVVVSSAHAPAGTMPVMIGAEATTTSATASLRALGSMRAA